LLADHTFSKLQVVVSSRKPHISLYVKYESTDFHFEIMLWSAILRNVDDLFSMILRTHLQSAPDDIILATKQS
jgi:hypothetical protein